MSAKTVAWQLPCVYSCMWIVEKSGDKSKHWISTVPTSQLASELSYTMLYVLFIAEPEIEATREAAHPSLAIEMLRLKHEVCSGRLELQLTWDPTAGYTRSTARFMASDRALDWGADDRMKAETGSAETYESYETALMHGALCVTFVRHDAAELILLNVTIHTTYTI